MMNLTVGSTDFRNLIKRVNPTHKKNMRIALECNDNKLIATKLFDSDLVQASTPAKIESEGTIVVESHDLAWAIKNGNPKGSVRLEQPYPDSLMLAYQFDPAINYPCNTSTIRGFEPGSSCGNIEPTHYQPADQFSFSVNELRTLINAVDYAMSDDTYRDYLRGIFLHHDYTNDLGLDFALKAVATDGHQLAVKQASPISGQNVHFKAFLPRPVVKAIKPLLGKDVCPNEAISFKVYPDNEIFAQYKDFSILAPTMADPRYPVYDNAIPRLKDSFIVNTQQFEEAVKQAARLCKKAGDRRVAAVELQITPNKVRVTSQSNGDRFMKELEANSLITQPNPNGSAKEVKLNGNYLLTLLKQYKDSNDIRVGFQQDNRIPVVAYNKVSNTTNVLMTLRY